MSLQTRLLLSKWVSTLERHRADIVEIEREIAEYAASFDQPRLPIERIDRQPTPYEPF